MQEENGRRIDIRRKKILSLLEQEGQVRVSQLSDLFGTTVVTIRSDLDALEREGYLERVQGGAVLTVNNFYHLDFQARKQKNVKYKKAIAAATAAMVQDGETLMMNSGTTTYFTAVELKRHKNLNVVTNSISVAIELGAVPSFRVILLGGEINAQYSFLYGADAQEQLSRYKADKAILSIDGISEPYGLTTYHAEEAMIDRCMMERARQTLVVADYSKLGHESFSFISETKEADIWITNDCADSAESEAVAACGVQVFRCPGPTA